VRFNLPVLRDRDLTGELRLALKMASASTLAWWLCTLLGQQRPIFAALIPLVALSGDPFSVVSVSLSRVLGVFAGVGIAIGLVRLDLELLPLVALALLCTTLVGIGLRIGDRPNIEPAFSALFLIAVAKSGLLSTGIARLWETAIGAVVAVVFAAFVWPPNPVRELEHRLDRLRRELVDDLVAVAADLAGESGAAERRLEQLREHSREAMRDVFELERAQRAMRWNPLRERHAAQFAELERRINLAARLYRHARAIARDVADADLPSTELAAAIRELIEASDLALRGESHEQPLARAEELLATDAQGDALILRAQLQQLLDDLRALG
jgi:uncharacterized membrane protein YgaE (UPF0421/DUF939 family)